MTILTPVWLAISEVGKNPHGLDTRIGLVVLFDLLRVNLPLWDHKLGSPSYCHGRRPGWMEKNNLQAWDTGIPGNQSSTLEIRCLFFSPTNSTTKANKKIHHWKTGGSTPKSCWLKGSGTEPGMREKSKLNSVKELRLVEENQIREKIYWWLIRLFFFHAFPRPWHHNFQISSFGGGFRTCFMSLR